MKSSPEKSIAHIKKQIAKFESQLETAKLNRKQFEKVEREFNAFPSVDSFRKRGHTYPFERILMANFFHRGIPVDDVARKFEVSKMTVYKYHSQLAA